VKQAALCWVFCLSSTLLVSFNSVCEKSKQKTRWPHSLLRCAGEQWGPSSLFPIERGTLSCVPSEICGWWLMLVVYSVTILCSPSGLLCWQKFRMSVLWEGWLLKGLSVAWLMSSVSNLTFWNRSEVSPSFPRRHSHHSSQRLSWINSQPNVKRIIVTARTVFLAVDLSS